MSHEKKRSEDEISNSASNNSFFSQKGVKHLLARLNQKQYKDRIERNNLLLDLIRARQPISKYKLAKISGISYATIKRILRELEFCEIVMITISTNSETGMPVQLLSIPKSDREKKLK